MGRHGSDGRSEFQDRVRCVVREMREGEIATYGEVAEEAGFPGAARAVGNVLARGNGLPWWRVVSATGRLVPGHEAEHARRLRQEGITVVEGRIRRSKAAVASSPLSSSPRVD
jgi:methylated-DNA-protein-cysteine methyltransferase-like protein